MVWWAIIPYFDYQEKKSKKKIPVDGYEADLENTEKISPPTPKKPRKAKRINVISKPETTNSSKPNETDENPILSVIQAEEINSFSQNSEWEHLSEFEDIFNDSSDNN